MTGVRCKVKQVSGPPVLLVPSPRVTKVIVVVQHHHLNKGLIMAITLSSIAISCIVLSIIFFWIIWPENHLVQGFKDIQNMMMNMNTFFAKIEYSSLELATKKFSENNILREGRLGHIYQSCFDGVLAAVMKLDGCGQGYERMFDVNSISPFS